MKNMMLLRLQFLFHYIENNDECQYTFPELKDLINKLSDEKHVFSDYILQNLKKKTLKIQ